MPISPRLVVLSLFLCAACSESGVGGPGADGGPAVDGGGSDGGAGQDGGGLTCPAGVQSVVVSPNAPVLTINSATPPQQAFTAQGMLAGGGLVPITVNWSVSRSDDGPTGTIDANGLYTADANGGGLVTVRADGGGCTGTATIEIRVDRAVSTGDAPVDAPTIFTGAPTVDAGQTPVFVYPSEGTRFPRNVFKILFQWRRSGNDVFRVTLSGAHGRVVVYTGGGEPACAAVATAGCWEAPDDVWSWIASTHAGETVEVRVAGALRATPGTFYEAAPLHIGFSKRDVRGAIFYWSTTAAGIRRTTVSNLPPDDYLVKGQTVGGTDVNCAACHTLSRDGQKLGAYINGNLWVTQVTSTAPPPPIFQGMPGPAPKRTWMTFSPDTTRIVVSAAGVLSHRDASNGALIAPIALPQGKFATHPDWSPDGTRLAVALSEDSDSDNVSASDLALLLVAADGGFGPAQTLVPRDGGQTNAYPSFSPDGRYLAFVRSQSKTHGDATGKIWLIPAAGGQPTRLDRANFVVNDGTVAETTNLGNGMPTWAPRGDLDWIAFNSTRAYGVVYTAGPKQIWIAAVDLAALEDGGVDPSYPAFRLPFQDLSENNHRPFWALDVRRDVPDGGFPDGGASDGGFQEDGGVGCKPVAAACDQELLECCAHSFCDGPDADGGFACAPLP